MTTGSLVEPYASDAADVVAALGVDPEAGLAVASFAIGQVATGVVVASLVTFNVVMGSNQELKARASVEALAQLQVPHGPMQLLFCKFFVVVTVVVGFIADVPDPSVMQRPPRKPGTRIVNPPRVVRWLISGFVVAAAALAVLQWGPDEPSTEVASVSMTMAFAVVALSAVNLGVVMRREREAPWSSPLFPYYGWLLLGWALTWAAVELPMLQRLLDTTSLTGGQWVVAIALSLLTPTLVGLDKAVQIHRRAGGRRVGATTRETS